MGSLRVSLFGKFSVAGELSVLQGFETLKVQELFCYLLLFRLRPHPRESLASLLWGDTSTSQAKRYLSKALWQLQEALSQVSPGAKLLAIEPDWIQLDPQATFWLDVAVLEQAYQLVRDVPGEQLDDGQVQVIQEAVRCCQGDLLAGWYQDWCLCERERLQFLTLSLLDRLIRFSQARGEYEAGRLYAYQILSYDRAREQTHRQLMRLYYLAGDRTGALRQYQQCREVLMAELGVEPSRRTRDLHRRIQADEPLLLPAFSPSSTLPAPAGENEFFNPPVGASWQFAHLAQKVEQVRLELEGMERDLRSMAGASSRAQLR
jgi:DNA-binding SARP family transcriptional activator